MTPVDRNADEEALAELLAQYDESLAGDTPAVPTQASTIGWKTALAAECERAKACLELLDRVRRRWSPPGVNVSDVHGISSTVERMKPQIVTIGRFRVERELGRGGLGIVHLAFDPKLGRQVALKVPRFDLLASDELRRRFLREAEAAARLSHPNLVTVFEAGEDGTICYLTSEYCGGQNLAQWLQSTRKSVAPRTAALVVRRLALAVQHAHGRGVLHRDIKPSNILFDSSADDDLPWQPKLADFGMAKLLERDGSETRTGAMIGTPAYMAPEQAEGRIRDLDARTDVYALGAVLYEILTRHAPAFGESDAESLRKVLCEEPMTPRRLRKDVPRDLEAICLKCLARRREHRYATAQELANDLQRFLDGRPTEARPLSALGVALKWGRRRPAVAMFVALTMVGAALSATGVVAYTLKVRRHAEELSLALTSRDEAKATAQSHADATARAYSSDVRLAQQAWKEGRVSAAKAWLAKHEPRTPELDHRSFAWHFLSRLCESESTTLKGHEGPVYVCRYSPDGEWLATGGEDGKLRLWDPASGALKRSWPAHDTDISGIAFSPDSKSLATTADGQQAAVWDAATGALVHRFGMLPGVTLATVFTPDGQTLIAGSDEGVVSLLDTADWSVRAQFADLPKPLLLAAVSHDGKVLATTSNDSTIQTWALPAMTPLATLEGHTRHITAIAFMHDGTKLASASQDGTVKVWQPATRKPLVTYEGKTDYIRDISFSADDGRLLLAGSLGEAQAWDLATDRCELVLRTGSAPIYSAAVSPAGGQVSTAGGDELVHLWNASPDPEKRRVLADVSGRAVAMSPDGSTFAVGDNDGNVRYFSSLTGELLNLFAAHTERIDGICFSQSGDLQAIGFQDGSVRLWHFPDLTPSHVLAGHTDRIWAVAISADGKRVASCSNDRSVRIWDTSTGSSLRTLSIADDNPKDVAFSPDGRLLAVGCRRGTIRIVQVSDGALVPALSGHDDEVLCVAWSPDGKRLASGAVNGALCLWDTARFAMIRRVVSGQESVESVAFSPDGRTLASGGKQRMIKTWNIASQEETLQLTGHRGIVSQVFFSPNGDELYSFSPGAGCELFAWPSR